MGVMEFNNMLASNSDFLRPFAVSLTRDNDAASDLCQETLYRALMNRDKYNVGTNIRAWLYTIMRNLFINDYRRQMKHKIVYVPADGHSVLSNQHAQHSDTASHILEKDILARVHNLPAIFSDSFRLYIEGYRYHEIANLLNEPLGTVKSRIHFARKLLREQIERN